MDILRSLPVELQTKIKYLVLEHPVAKIIKDEIERLKCHLTFKFKDEHGSLFCKINGRDFFANQYFHTFNSRKTQRVVMGSEGIIEYIDSETSDEYLDEVYDRLFFVQSESTSSDDE